MPDWSVQTRLSPLPTNPPRAVPAASTGVISTFLAAGASPLVNALDGLWSASYVIPAACNATSLTITATHYTGYDFEARLLVNSYASDLSVYVSNPAGTGTTTGTVALSGGDTIQLMCFGYNVDGSGGMDGDITMTLTTSTGLSATLSNSIIYTGLGTI